MSEIYEDDEGDDEQGAEDISEEHKAEIGKIIKVLDAAITRLSLLSDAGVTEESGDVNMALEQVQSAVDTLMSILPDDE